MQTEQTSVGIHTFCVELVLVTLLHTFVYKTSVEMQLRNYRLGKECVT